MIQIEFDDQCYTVFVKSNGDGGYYEIAYGDKHTSMEDHAQNLYELAAVLNAQVSMGEV